MQSVGNRTVGNPTFGVVVGASPFTYMATLQCAAVVSGGSVSVISYTRGGTVTALGLLNGIVELNVGDSITITWLITKPILTIIPR